ncbi:LOW QUALITY PROTEIN: Uncharacterized protein GBIM_01758 [Gryllus bimaculatus]|nr:LOW QUALITY PROTEIN: Uncharacterized protein GBIM_01758 [Gryllus bimaculatus]
MPNSPKSQKFLSPPCERRHGMPVPLDNVPCVCACSRDGEERSYIFLLYPPDVVHTLNPDLYIVRVPFRSLVVGLLAHQMLLQTVGSVLLQGTRHVIPSLANVLLSSPGVGGRRGDGGADEEPENRLSGLMAHMQPEHIQTLLACLDLSYDRAIDFDSRPGLKFLVQKEEEDDDSDGGGSGIMRRPGSLPVPLAGAAGEGGEGGAGGAGDAGGGLGDMSVFLRRLRRSFDRLCDTYVDVVLDKDGQHSAVDHISDQPIFFLIAQPDDFPEIRRKETPPPPPPNALQHQQTAQEACGAAGAAGQAGPAGAGAGAGAALGEALALPASPGHSSRPPSVAASSLLDSEDDVFEDDPPPAPALDDGRPRPFALADFARRPSTGCSGDESDGAPLTRVDENTLCAGESPPPASVYRVAGRREVAGLVGEYKRRKQTRAMPPPPPGALQPPQQALVPRRNPFADAPAPAPPPCEPVPVEIEQQRRTSLFRDSEAHRKVWAEMLGSVFDLLSQLDDARFRALLPVLFHGVRRLTAHAADAGLKQAVAELFHRVAMLYGFSPERRAATAKHHRHHHQHTPAAKCHRGGLSTLPLSTPQDVTITKHYRPKMKAARCHQRGSPPLPLSPPEGATTTNLH